MNNQRCFARRIFHCKNDAVDSVSLLLSSQSVFQNSVAYNKLYIIQNIIQVLYWKQAGSTWKVIWKCSFWSFLHNISRFQNDQIISLGIEQILVDSSLLQRRVVTHLFFNRVFECCLTCSSTLLCIWETVPYLNENDLIILKFRFVRSLKNSTETFSVSFLNSITKFWKAEMRSRETINAARHCAQCEKYF